MTQSIVRGKSRKMTKRRFRDLLQQDPQSGKGRVISSRDQIFFSCWAAGPGTAMVQQKKRNKKYITHQWRVSGVIKLIQQKFLRLFQDCCDLLVMSIRDCVTQRRQT